MINRDSNLSKQLWKAEPHKDIKKDPWNGCMGGEQHRYEPPLHTHGYYLFDITVCHITGY